MGKSAWVVPFTLGKLFDEVGLELLHIEGPKISPMKVFLTVTQLVS